MMKTTSKITTAGLVLGLGLQTGYGMDAQPKTISISSQMNMQHEENINPYNLKWLFENFALEIDQVQKVETICDSQYSLRFKTKESAEQFSKTMERAGCSILYIDFMKEVTFLDKESLVNAAKNKNNSLSTTNLREDIKPEFRATKLGQVS